MLYSVSLYSLMGQPSKPTRYIPPEAKAYAYSSRFEAFWPGELELLVDALRLLEKHHRRGHSGKVVATKDLLADAQAAFDRSCLAEAAVDYAVKDSAKWKKSLGA